MAMATLRAGTVSVLLGAFATVSMSAAVTLATTVVAIANGQSETGAEKSSGSKTSGNKSGAAASNSADNSAFGLLGILSRRNAPAQPTTAASVANYAPQAPVAPRIRPGNGKFAAEIKNLNAAGASLVAYLHAHPDSQIGRIATYRETRVGYQELSDQIAGLEDAYMENFDTKTTRSTEEILLDIDAAVIAGDETAGLDAEHVAAGELESLYDDRATAEHKLDTDLAAAAAPNEPPSGEALDYFVTLLRLDEGSLFKE